MDSNVLAVYVFLFFLNIILNDKRLGKIWTNLRRDRILSNGIPYCLQLGMICFIFENDGLKIVIHKHKLAQESLIWLEMNTNPNLSGQLVCLLCCVFSSFHFVHR